MLCAKHNNDITDNNNKEQFGDIWLCRKSIWDSETVREIITIPAIYEKVRARVLNPNAKVDEAKAFWATNPTDEQIQEFLENVKKS